MNVRGLASYLEILQAQADAEQFSIDLIAAQAHQLSDTVAFYQYMGGGGR